MANLINKDITDAGRILIADVHAGAVLVPTRIVMGSGMMPEGKTVQSMTAVVTPVLELEVTKRVRRNDGGAIFGGTYQSDDITTAFFFREIALFCKAEYRDASGNVTKTVPECLYLYGNFGEYPDLLPAYGGETVIERHVDLVAWVGGAGAKVELHVESSLNPSFDDLNNLKEELYETLDSFQSQAEPKRLEFHGTAVPRTAFAADDAYEDYPYRAAIPLPGVLGSMTPDVTFAVPDAVSGSFAPVAECYAGGVYIWAASVPEGTTTIPTIKCWKAVS